MENTCLIKHECKPFIHTYTHMYLHSSSVWKDVQCFKHLQWAGWRWGDSPQALAAKTCLGHLALTQCLFDRLSDWLTDWLKRFQVPCTTFTFLPAICHNRFFPQGKVFLIQMSTPLPCRFHLKDFLPGLEFRTHSMFEMRPVLGLLVGGKPEHREYLRSDANEESIKILRLGIDHIAKL